MREKCVIAYRRTSIIGIIVINIPFEYKIIVRRLPRILYFTKTAKQTLLYLTYLTPFAHVRGCCSIIIIIIRVYHDVQSMRIIIGSSSSQKQWKTLCNENVYNIVEHIGSAFYLFLKNKLHKPVYTLQYIQFIIIIMVAVSKLIIFRTTYSCIVLYMRRRRSLQVLRYHVESQSKNT